VNLDLTDEETRAPLNLLVETIEADPAGAGLRQAVNSETLNISDCGKRPAGLHSLTRCWWATRISIVCRC
jgi:hypothetical protein